LRISVQKPQPEGYLFHIANIRRIDMEKQLTLLLMEENNDFFIWENLTKENQHKIENLFAKILIRYLHSLLEEVKEYEKG
jgi:hypothetical protein